ncbi:MAG: prepilin-type N-terminal cleavage/methylation domain-containing protein [Candidatus Peribacteraceae bacterium]|nr:prepilin-type N-terminal cleavage/methylation domain-containing protein [Candidatus Peribacteraceae bacterium]
MENWRKLISARSGFTLVELIVVIVIITTITVAALPGFINSFRRGQFENSVAKVVVMLEKARTQALASELDFDQKIPPGGYGVFFDFTSEADPTNQKVILFVDSWNNDPDGDGSSSDAREVNVNYADEDIASRTLPDGIYTDGGDIALSTIEVNSPPYVQIAALRGEQLADGAEWVSAPGNTVTVIFKPPYAETTIFGNSITPLQNFEADFNLVTESSTRTIKFNRVTTTAQVIQN